MKRTLCILLSLMLAVTGLVGLGVSASAVAVGEIIEFGNYPQSKETNSTVIAALNDKAGSTATWNSYGYYSGSGSISDGQMTAKDFMRYKDVMYGETKYRGVYFDSYRPNCTGYTFSSSYQGDNGYSSGTIYWFKYEPLTWRVLDSSTGLILCEKIIDSQAFNNYILSSGRFYYGNASLTYYPNNYYYSSLRQWLNDDFYNTAFTDTQKNNIEQTTLDNSCYNSSYADYNAPSSNDKIFLLSYNDTKNTNYGFASSASTSDTARRTQGTDYAKCQNLSVSTTPSTRGNSWWWLRSAGSVSDRVCGVAYDGYSGDNSEVSRSNGGVRPACRVPTLTSDVPEPNRYTVTVTANPSEGGTVTGGGTYTDGQTATITVTPNSGWDFVGWYLNGTFAETQTSFSCTVTSNLDYVARFEKLPTTCTVSVSADPSEGGTVTGGGYHFEGVTTTVTATPNKGWIFTGWFEGGAKVSDNANYSFTVTGNVTLTAKFADNTADNPTKDAELYALPAATVAYKSTVTVIAEASGLPQGYFVALYDGDTQLAKGDNKTVSYTMTKMKAGKTLTAKVIDANGSVQSSAHGDLEKEIKITVKTGFFDKVKAFFQSLFGLLPKITLNAKPDK